MVKFRFCPQCASLDIQSKDNGQDYCLSCNYVGVAMEGAMDKLDAYRKNLKKTSGEMPGKTGAKTSLGFSKPGGFEKPKKRSTDDFEIM